MIWLQSPRSAPAVLLHLSERSAPTSATEQKAQSQGSSNLWFSQPSKCHEQSRREEQWLRHAMQGGKLWSDARRLPHACDCCVTTANYRTRARTALGRSGLHRAKRDQASRTALAAPRLDRFAVSVAISQTCPSTSFRARSAHRSPTRDQKRTGSDTPTQAGCLQVRRADQSRTRRG